MNYVHACMYVRVHVYWYVDIYVCVCIMYECVGETWKFFLSERISKFIRCHLRPKSSLIQLWQLFPFDIIYSTNSVAFLQQRISIISTDRYRCERYFLFALLLSGWLQSTFLKNFNATSWKLFRRVSARARAFSRWCDFIQRRQKQFWHISKVKRHRANAVHLLA